MNETPITDAFAAQQFKPCDWPTFARELERKLSAKIAEHEQTIEDLALGSSPRDILQTS